MFQPKQLSQVYLRAKKLWSFLIATILFWQRATLPVLSNEYDVNSLIQELKYTGDGPFGMLDFVQRAERSYYHILRARKKGKEKYWWPMIDCDDYAELARRLFEEMGWESELMVIVDPGLKMSHVICRFLRPDGTLGTVDTNGLRYWNRMDEAVAYFGQIYKTSYELQHDPSSPV
jgi:hypothetical protein